MKAVFKAVFRDIYFHKGRSFITFFALFLVIAFPIAMFSTSPSIQQSIDANNEQYHLAHLDIRAGPTPASFEHEIREAINDSLGQPPDELMMRLAVDTKLNLSGVYYMVETIGINTSSVPAVNQVKIQEGTFDLASGEIVMLDSFAAALGIAINDSLTLTFGDSNATFTVVGFVKGIDFLSYDLIQHGLVYIQEDDLRELVGFPPGFSNDVVIYFYNGITEDDITQAADSLRSLFDNYSIPVYLVWHTRSISYSAILSHALDLTSSYLSTSAILIVITVGLVIYIITKRYAVEQRKQTGMLYSYGFSSRTIMAAFLLRTAILLTFAGISGVVAGRYLLKFLTNFLGNEWGLLGVTPAFSVEIVESVLVTAVVVSLLFTYFAAKENVSLTPYEAIRGKEKGYSQSRNISRFVKFPMWVKIPFRNIGRGKRRSLLTVLAFSGSIMLSFSLIVTQTSLQRTQDDYFSKIDWDIQADFIGIDQTGAIADQVNNITGIEASEPYLQFNVQFYEPSNKISNLRGVLANSTLAEIDLQEGRYFSNEVKPEVILSQYTAASLGYHVGENISFWFLDTRINVTVVGLSRTMDFPIALFIQLETLEDIFGYMPVNGMLLDVDNARLNQIADEINSLPSVSFAIKKERFENQIRNIVASQTIIVNIMVGLGFIVSFLSIFSTTLIIVIERNREFALQRVFGFSMGQILGQIFIEIMVLSGMALAIGFIAGNFLSFYWEGLIARDFFTVDSYYIWTDYISLAAFSVLVGLFSIYPEIKALGGQNLAEAIKEE